MLRRNKTRRESFFFPNDKSGEGASEATYDTQQPSSQAAKGWQRWRSPSLPWARQHKGHGVRVVGQWRRGREGLLTAGDLPPPKQPRGPWRCLACCKSVNPARPGYHHHHPAVHINPLCQWDLASAVESAGVPREPGSRGSTCNEHMLLADGLHSGRRRKVRPGCCPLFSLLPSMEYRSLRGGDGLMLAKGPGAVGSRTASPGPAGCALSKSQPSGLDIWPGGRPGREKKLSGTSAGRTHPQQCRLLGSSGSWGCTVPLSL